MKTDIEIDITNIKRSMLVKFPSFGFITSNMNFIEDREIYSNGQPTCATDGKNFLYHPDCWNNKNHKQKLYLVAHEVFHIAYDHIERGKGKDSECWNIAADAVVNAHLKKAGIELDEFSVDRDDAYDYDVEEYYEKLVKEKQNNNNNNNKSSNSSKNGKQNSSDNDVGHDTHKLWGKQNKMEENSQSAKDRIEEFVKKGEKKSFEENEMLRRKNLEELKKSLLTPGEYTSEESLNIGDIGTSKSILTWNRLLKSSAKNNLDWSYRNATIENGVLTPHLESNPSFQTEILLDTSGSINATLLRNFLRECKNILQDSELKVGCFDKKFYGFNRIRTEKDIDNMKLIGGGGTDFDVAVNAFSNRPGNKIVFTDGWADIPKKSVNAIWIVFENKDLNPPGGKVIYINENELKELNSLQNLNNSNRRR